jgi:hypothetical protein
VVEVGDAQRAAPATKLIVATVMAFHALEERQNVSIAPAQAAHLRPSIEILALAAHERHAVDRTGTAKQQGARYRQRAAIRVRLRLRRIQPVGPSGW